MLLILNHIIQNKRGFRGKMYHQKEIYKKYKIQKEILSVPKEVYIIMMVREENETKRKTPI